MADFALGLAKTAVEGTLSRVQSAIDEEDKQKKAVRQDLVFITGEFQMMQSFLNLASKERARNEVVRTWVRQLRDLAFDVEDCVEFVIHLDNDSAWKWVWRLMPSCMAPPRTRDLDDAVAELKQLKERAEEVSQRNIRYTLINDSGSNPVSQSPPVQLATTGPSTIDILMELWEANGKHRGFGNLQKLITSEGNGLQVISLWGSGGSDIEGTQQVINKAYCDPEICHIFKRRAWVKLMHPFNPDEFLKNLKTQLQASSRSCQAVDFNRKNLEDDPMNQLTEQRYLVVLQGIPSVVEWDIIRMYLPENNNGSRIVVSTKQIGDAIFFAGDQYRVSVLRAFTSAHYLCAFHSKGSGRRNVMGDLIGLLRRPGVISVWGTGDDKTTLCKELFNFTKYVKGKILNSQYTEVVRYIWVDVAHPFNLKDFYLSFLHSFLIYDTDSNEDDTETAKSVEDIKMWLQLKLLRRHTLVVLNGLQSTKEWQLIKNVLEMGEFAANIIVITNDESLARRCVDHEYRMININDVAIHPLMQIHSYVDELFWRLRHHTVMSVYGAGGDMPTLLKHVYDGIKHQNLGFREVEKFDYYVWVDLPHPFDVNEFGMRLIKGLFPYTDDYEEQDMDEDVELHESFLRAHKKKCIFIINGLESMGEWQSIKLYLMGWNTESRIILIANEESVANHFVEHPEANTAIGSLTKAFDYYGYGHNDKASWSIFLSNRTQVTELLVSQREVFDNMTNSWERAGVTSVWGIAGVGKSTLVRDYFGRKIRGMDGKFAWVDVPDPFDLMEFSRLLLLDFHRCDLEAMEAASIGILLGQDPIEGCREIMCQGEYLIIIDGLRSTNDWDLIETSFLSQPTTMSKKVIVITTEESIAKHSVKQQVDQMINIKCLEDGMAYNFFKQLIDPNGTELASRMEKVDFAKLVAKCGGLPKVVSAICKVSWSFLEHMNDDFMFTLEADPQFHSLSGLLSWMHSYFDACSDLIKPCIFYLSVFPANSKIRRGRLVRRWIAEGYSRDAPGCTARENAQKRFSELVELSIIQQGTSKVISKVNGFFREYIISRPMEDNLVFALDGCCSPTPNTQHTGKHLTIMAAWNRDQKLFDSIDFARLRSLTVFGTWCSFFISDKMKRIRVLDLEGMMAVTNDDVEQISVKLLSLKFISLRGCTKISRLPDTLGGLRQLETLDVRFTSIVMLPSAIIKLQKLQYSRAGTDQDWTSASLEDGNGVTSQLPAATSPEVEGGDGVTSQLPAVTSPELGGRDISICASQPTVQTSLEHGIAESPAQAARSTEAQHMPMQAKVGWTSKLSFTSVPRLPKFPPVTWSLCGAEREKLEEFVSVGKANHNGGVELPVGIENLAALHTVGVVNVNAAAGETFLKELKRLTQLLKLRVCGINKNNLQLLCRALSDHGHLESLSVRFDEDCVDDSFKPPKTLKSLKLYGPIGKLPDTIKLLVNLKKLDLEMTITGPDDVHLFLKEKLPRQNILNRVCIKVQGDQELDFSLWEFMYWHSSDSYEPRVVKIDCSSKLEVTFGQIFSYVEVLIIQCSQGSSFRVSGNGGLHTMHPLKTVWLKGSYSEEQRVQLKELVDGHYKKTAVLKLEPL